MAASSKIIVIDDDPTGSQTVHSCPLLLRWDAATLAAGLRHPSPLLFLLANTRALAAALPLAGIERWWLVSRGDSTLRGHFPLEVEVIAAELGPFAATLLIPAFFEGGRTTWARAASCSGRSPSTATTGPPSRAANRSSRAWPPSLTA